MGKGEYVPNANGDPGGVFNLFVTFEYEANENRRAEWKRSFEYASQLLWNATEGQIQFGRIEVRNNNDGASDADALLLTRTGQSFNTGSGIGKPQSWMCLCDDERYKPFVIIHELGHYAFDLGDEYRTIDWNAEEHPNGDASCTADVRQRACIMEFKWKDGMEIDLKSGDLVIKTHEVSEFCNATTHPGVSNNCQQEKHGESCWETIGKCYKDLQIPAAGSVPNPVLQTMSQNRFQWVEVVGRTRVFVILDPGFSQGPFESLSDFVSTLSLFFSTMDQRSQNDFGLTVPAFNLAPVFGLRDSFSDELLVPLQNSPPRDASVQLVSFAQLIQLLNIGEQPISNPNLLWISDRDNVTDEQAASAGELFRSMGIRFHGVSFGSQENSWQQIISQKTLGTVAHATTQSSRRAQQSLLAGVLEAAWTTNDHVGMLTQQTLAFPKYKPVDRKDTHYKPTPATPPFTPERLSEIQKFPLNASIRYLSCDTPVYVESDAAAATFASLFESDKPVDMYLQRPDGTIVDPTQLASPHAFRQHNNYQMYWIDQPAAGQWVMRVRRNGARQKVSATVMAASINPKIHGGLSVERECQQPDQYQVRMQVTAPGVVGGLDPVYLEIYRCKRELPDLPTQIVRLQPVTEEMHPSSYVATIRLRGPGAYLLRAWADSHGRAVAWGEGWFGHAAADAAPKVPRFSRLFQQWLFVPEKQPDSM